MEFNQITVTYADVEVFNNNKNRNASRASHTKISLQALNAEEPTAVYM